MQMCFYCIYLFFTFSFTCKFCIFIFHVLPPNSFMFTCYIFNMYVMCFYFSHVIFSHDYILCIIFPHVERVVVVLHVYTCISHMLHLFLSVTYLSKCTHFTYMVLFFMWSCIIHIMSCFLEFTCTTLRNVPSHVFPQAFICDFYRMEVAFFCCCFFTCKDSV